MKFTPFQLAALAVGGFVSIVLLNVLSKYQSNADFREQFASNFSPAELLNFRSTRIAEEHMQQPVAAAPAPDFSDGDIDEAPSNGEE